jgi:polyisoprenoid-binding protein YceI
MKKQFIFSMLLMLSMHCSIAQNKLFTTNTGTISFDAGTGVEDIKATSKAAVSVLKPSTGDLQMQVTITTFEFKSQLMEDHFNENYMESEKYPKSTFKGTITNMNTVNMNKPGNYAVKVKGTLEMHGVAKEVETTGTLNVTAENVTAIADFTIALKDYNINIPGAVTEKLSKTCKISVNCTMAAKK